MKFILSLLMITLSLGASAKNLKIMEYNVENLFDTAHDEGTDDWTYLPLTFKNSYPGFREICERMSSDYYVKECLNLDWNEALLTKKIVGIAKVVKSFDDTGKGPDILVLEEVENKNVLNKLVTKGLSGLGYQYQILIEGDDTRGIDVAIISKYPVINSKRYPIFVDGVKLDTRGILEVKIAVDNQEVVVYANHWPSQSNPASHRVAAAKLMHELATSQKADLIVALGDFNTIASDTPAPFSFIPDFIDSEKEARKVQTTLNGGTHFYRGEWTSLDKIFIHKKSALKPQYDKFQIMNRSFMLKPDHQSGQMIPVRFNFSTGEGFSDHLPLGMEFLIK